MRVTVEVDRLRVTYYCVSCHVRLSLDGHSAGIAGPAFVEAHRYCESDQRATVATVATSRR